MILLDNRRTEGEVPERKEEEIENPKKTAKSEKVKEEVKEEVSTQEPPSDENIAADDIPF